MKRPKQKVDVYQKGDTLHIDVAIKIIAPIERFIINLDPERFGCHTPEEKREFGKNLQNIVNEVYAVNEAMNLWLGNNNSKDSVEAFEAGWNNHMDNKKDKPDYEEACGFNYDWKEGWHAAKKYNDCNEGK